MTTLETPTAERPDAQRKGLALLSALIPLLPSWRTTGRAGRHRRWASQMVPAPPIEELTIDRISTTQHRISWSLM